MPIPTGEIAGKEESFSVSVLLIDFRSMESNPLASNLLYLELSLVTARYTGPTAPPASLAGQVSILEEAAPARATPTATPPPREGAGSLQVLRPLPLCPGSFRRELAAASGGFASNSW